MCDKVMTEDPRNTHADQNKFQDNLPSEYSRTWSNNYGGCIAFISPYHLSEILNAFIFINYSIALITDQVVVIRF